jgi:hypothetical protein
VRRVGVRRSTEQRIPEVQGHRVGLRDERERNRVNASVDGSVKNVSVDLFIVLHIPGVAKHGGAVISIELCKNKKL